MGTIDFGFGDFVDNRKLLRKRYSNCVNELILFNVFYKTLFTIIHAKKNISTNNKSNCTRLHTLIKVTKYYKN